jgi:hypothetical protein
MKEITSPDGVTWRVGDEVLLHSLDAYQEPQKTKIASIEKGNGSWARYQPDGDADAVWFGLTNGCQARPWLLERVN